MDKEYIWHDSVGNKIKINSPTDYYGYCFIDDISSYYSTSTATMEIIFDGIEQSPEDRIKMLKKKLKHCKSPLERKQIQQELDEAYRERKKK